MTPAKSVFIVAGEASGDLHAAKLIKELLTDQPELVIEGVGGLAMQQAGATLHFNLAQYGVTGFIEVLRHSRLFVKTFKLVLKRLMENPPSLLILVDYPGFNLRLAKKAKKLGIKVLYYISPQIWAWKKKRINTIKQTVDRMAVIFPFEYALYHQKKIPVSYVGHPSLETVKATIAPHEMKQLLGLEKTDKLVALLPGSRLNEVEKLLPIMIMAAELLKEKFSNLYFVIIAAPTISQEVLKNFIAQSYLPIKIISEQCYDVMHSSDAAMIASGTATLEAALLQLPMVICYKTAAVTYCLAKYFARIKHIGICNIIAGKLLVPELIQHHANPQTIAYEVSRMLENDIYRQHIRQELGTVKHILQSEMQPENLSQVVFEMMG